LLCVQTVGKDAENPISTNEQEETQDRNDLGSLSTVFLKDITIPLTATEIDAGAFSGCDPFWSIVLPPRITEIKNSTFYSCSGLRSVTLPEWITSLGDDAFCDCYNLASIHLPRNLMHIGEYAFHGCRMLPGIIPSERIGR
jgi:hypothetical protein